MRISTAGTLAFEPSSLKPHVSSLPSPREPVVFTRLRGRVVANWVSVVLRRSRLRLTLILVFSLGFWLGLFGMFFEAFQFLNRFLRVKSDIVGSLLGLLFIWLFVMLIFSSGIIVYNGLFKSREAAFLRTLPARPDHIFAYKLQEAIGFSSWGFVL